MTPANLIPSDPITVQSLLHNFSTNFDINGIHDIAAMWLFRYFMIYLAKAALANGVRATNEDDPQRKWRLTTYSQVASFRPAPYATDNVIAEAEAEKTNFKKPKGMFTVHHSETLQEKALRCARLYNESRLQGVFFKALHESIRFSMRIYWNAHKGATVQNLVRYATSPSNSQEGTKSTSTQSNNHGEIRK